MYIENLNKISKKTYLDNFISKNKNKIEKFNSHIYADYFYFDNARNYGIGLYYFLLSDFYYHASNIRKKIEKEKKVEILKKDNSELMIRGIKELNSLSFSPLFIDQVICTKGDQNISINVKKDLDIFSETSVKLPKEKNLNALT